MPERITAPGVFPVAAQSVPFTALLYARHVKNNPINFIDPTGHWEDEGCGSGDLCELPVKKKDPPVEKDSGGETNSGSACQGTNPSILCLPAQTPQPTLPLNPIITPTNPRTVDFIDLEWKIIFMKYAFAGVDLLSDAEDLVNTGRPVYKHVKWGFGTGPVEALLDGLLYGFDDRWAVTMSDEVRITRMGVIAAESLAIDGTATLVGYGGNFLLGKPGDIAFQYLTSRILTQDVKPHVTNWAFNRLDLGLPNEWRK